MKKAISISIAMLAMHSDYLWFIGICLVALAVVNISSIFKLIQDAIYSFTESKKH